MQSEEFKKTLLECTKTAGKAYKKTVTYVEKLEELSDNLKSKLSKNEEAEKLPLAELRQFLEKGLKGSQDALKDDLKQWHGAIKKFTVSLFGRTKAGKSAIREALTCGDGSTIGKGGQRTTRDVREYTWEGLRVIDTPGLEAYQGADDAVKARGIIGQSDIVLFLTTDDSVQPGEFEEMAQLQEIAKYFIVLLNVKENIKSPKKLERFLANPLKLFDPVRIGQHEARIKNHVKEHLKITRLDIIPIQALAAFLSTQEEYKEWCKSLWQFSKMEHLKEKIIQEVNTRGRHHRVCTFFNCTIDHVDTVQKMLEIHCQRIQQLVICAEKKREVTRKFSQFNEDSLRKIEVRITEVFRPMEEEIPHFVDKYLGKPDVQQKWSEFFNDNKERAEKELKALGEEIKSEQKALLEEFDKECNYDVGFALSEDPHDLDKIKRGQMEKILKWTGTGIGGLSGVFFTLAWFGLANFWNPAGWTAIGVSVVVGIVAWFFKRHEKKKWEQKKKEIVQDLRNKVCDQRDKGIKEYKKGFEQKIIRDFQKDLLRVLETRISILKRLKAEIQTFNENLGHCKALMNKDLFAWLLCLEGIACNPKDIRSITREQGKETHVEMSLDCGNTLFKKAKENLSELLREQIHIKTV